MPMASWGSYSSLYGPFMALLGIGLLIGLLRWAFGHGSSVVERPALPGSPKDYGLLSAVASPPTYIEAEMVRQQLAVQGVKATLAMTNDGPRVMVWPADEELARKVLADK